MASEYKAVVDNMKLKTVVWTLCHQKTSLHAQQYQERDLMLRLQQPGGIHASLRTTVAMQMLVACAQGETNHIITASPGMPTSAVHALQDDGWEVYVPWFSALLRQPVIVSSSGGRM